MVATNDVGSGYQMVYIEPAAQVNVPAAALFSNTEYATLYYSTETTQGFSHHLDFKFAGFSAGYESSKSVTVTSLFWCSPDTTQYIERPHYAATYFDNELGGVVTTGIAALVPNEDWGSLPTTEYFEKTNLPTLEYVDFPVAPGGKEWTYQESGSTTWMASLNVPFAIFFQAFGQGIGIDTTTTCTSGSTNWVRYVIANPTPDLLNFRVYTPGTTPNQENKIGGMELHVWQM